MKSTSRSLRFEALETRLTPAIALDITAAGSFAESGGVQFVQADPQPTGTGNIHSFLRIQGGGNGGVRQGYNTDARPLQFDENKSRNFTRALPLSEVPVVNRGGGLYREFLLDINQRASQPLLSLDELRVYVGTSATAFGYNAADRTLDGMAPVYDLDAGDDSYVLLDYRLNSGSGSGDMLMYVPNSLFAGGTYVNVYSKFGTHFASNAGFQEWAVGQSPLTVLGGAISGMKFNDLNGDGIKDPEEPGLAGWVIFLDSNDNHELDDGEEFRITDSTGHYSFTNLAIGAGIVYRVREVPQEGWAQTTPDPDDIIFLSAFEVTSVDFGNEFRPN